MMGSGIASRRTTGVSGFAGALRWHALGRARERKHHHHRAFTAETMMTTTAGRLTKVHTKKASV
jgi:hypothetical protein